MLRRARRRERARARWADALRWVRGALVRAAGRRTARTAARPATLAATVGSLDRAGAPGRRRGPERAPPRRPQLRRAALCGPVLLNMVDAYEVYAALGDGATIECSRDGAAKLIFPIGSTVKLGSTTSSQEATQGSNSTCTRMRHSYVRVTCQAYLGLREWLHLY